MSVVPAARLEVLFSALAETPPYRHWLGVVNVSEWVGRPVMPVPVTYGTVSRHISRCQSRAVRSVMVLPGGVSELDVGCSRAREGVAQPHSQGGQSPSAKNAKSGTT